MLHSEKDMVSVITLSAVVEAYSMTAHILTDQGAESKSEARLCPQGMPQGPISSSFVPCPQDSPALALCLPSKTAPYNVKFCCRLKMHPSSFSLGLH